MDGAALLDGWLKSLAIERRLSVHSIRAYAGTGHRFLQHLAHIHGRPADLPLVEALSPADVRGFLAARRSEGLSNASAARELSALRTWVRWLEERHGARVPAFDAVKGPRVKKGLPRPLAPKEALALTETAGEFHEEAWLNARDTALLLLLWGAGLRLGEALALDDDCLPLPDMLVIRGKGRRERQIILLSAVRDAVEAYVRLRPWAIAKGKPLFRGARGGRMAQQSASLAVRRAREILGLPDTATPHALRHSFASHLLARGADLRTLQELLGHASLSSTQIYTAVDPTQLLDTWRTTHPRG